MKRILFGMSPNTETHIPKDGNVNSEENGENNEVLNEEKEDDKECDKRIKRDEGVVTCEEDKNKTKYDYGENTEEKVDCRVNCVIEATDIKKEKYDGGEKVDVGEKDDFDEKKKRFTLKQKIALVMLATVDFMSFCSMSIMAPFYPQEAAMKGMSESMAGVVFGFYALVVFISSPIFGKILPRVGVKFLFIVGVTTSGVCSVIFGTLHMIDDYSIFTTFSFLIRGLEALGASAYSTAGYVIIVNIFPDNAGAVRGLLETFVGLGMSVGPAIGGLLFTIGGFGLPFYVMGVIIIGIAPLNFYLLPSSKDCNVESKSGSLTSLLKIPCIEITCLIMIVIAMTWSYLDPTLEPHLRKYKLTPGSIGLIFLLMSAMYGIFSPCWGWVTDRTPNYHWLMSCGLLFSSFSLLLLGPSPLLYFIGDTIWLSIIALSLLGICVAMTLMPSYQAILDSALEAGFGDNIGTHSVIAGLWSSVYSLGEVLGPVIGGYLMEKVHFPITSTFFASLNLIMGLVAVFYFSSRKRSTVNCKPKEKKDDSRLETYKNDLCELTIVPDKLARNGVIKIENVKVK